MAAKDPASRARAGFSEGEDWDMLEARTGGEGERFRGATPLCWEELGKAGKSWKGQGAKVEDSEDDEETEDSEDELPGPKAPPLTRCNRCHRWGRSQMEDFKVKKGQIPDAGDQTLEARWLCIPVSPFHLNSFIWNLPWVGSRLRP